MVQRVWFAPRIFNYFSRNYRLGGIFAHSLVTCTNATAMSHPSPTYQVLVCIFLFGGNDGNNVVVPMSSSGYASYTSLRSVLGLQQSALLPVAANNGQPPYGFHPRLVNLQQLYNQRKA